MCAGNTLHSDSHTGHAYNYVCPRICTLSKLLLQCVLITGMLVHFARLAYAYTHHRHGTLAALRPAGSSSRTDVPP
eukprot:COSAG03_NODE_16365_length_404_cov_0.632787_1_plen_75_part_10